jgi:hypothetical protein
MTYDKDAASHPPCPKCHLPMREGQPSIFHEGHTFHENCAPKPEIAGDKDVIYPSLISI